MKKSFASDNYAGIHKEILSAMVNANEGHAAAYGADHWTKQAIDKFKEHFGSSIDVYFVLNGTGANVLALATKTESFNAVICADSAHINNDEGGAPEKFTGCKLLITPAKHGKLSVESIQHHLHLLGEQHHVQPKIISITQATEYGTVYTPQEIKDLADFAHAHNMLLHMDGARIANAAAFLNVSLKAITTDLGVDMLSFGGTKNGMMLGEAVIFFNDKFSKNFKYIRKQGMQLASKMRFISAQFIALLSHDLWHRNAQHSNKMAKKLAYGLSDISGITITQPVEANAVFAIMPLQAISHLQAHYPFYIWNKSTREVRLMTSFDTSDDDVEAFVSLARTHCS